METTHHTHHTTRLIESRLTVGVIHGGGHVLEFGFTHPIEIAPDEIFVAANRICSLDADIANLATDWQRTLRTALDRYDAPSMSVGDYFETTTPRGESVVRYTCDRTGWTITLGPAR